MPKIVDQRGDIGVYCAQVVRRKPREYSLTVGVWAYVKETANQMDVSLKTIQKKAVDLV